MTDPIVPPPDIRANLDAVKNKIEAALHDAQRPLDAAELVAVTKKFSAEKIMPAIDAGHRVFGENRVQETQEKWPDLKKVYPDVILHLIGSLQSNKVKEAVALFDVIETVDRPKIAEALVREMQARQKWCDCLVQVNTGEEPQKGGVSPVEAVPFARHCIDVLGLPVKGFMCIPPADQYPAPHFGLLHELSREAALSVVSMGMSSDYEMACQLGATHVRVGSGIFGQRPT